ncbi:MAG: 30S ribosomal protein S12 methylthiotransferase RimO [Verrucomicrobiota bacterium]
MTKTNSNDGPTRDVRPRSERPLRVGLISLGCAKNLVDAEVMLGSLLQHGMEITNDAAQADAVIVNTCSFIDAAQEESVDAILESVALREANRRGQAVIVSGCLPQRFRGELPQLLPEVDAFMGIDQVTRVGQIVEDALQNRRNRMGKQPTSQSEFRPAKAKITGRIAVLEKNRAAEERVRPAETGFPHLTQPATRNTSAASVPILEVTPRPAFVPDFATPRFRLTPRHFAYVKIAEGCNHPCSFCIIPRMRGPHRSRRQADIVAEVRALLADGVREINLISQDSTYYGLDLRRPAAGISSPQEASHPSRAISSPEKFSATVESLPANAATLCTLLRDLNSLPGDFWIRLLYTHPAHWTDELIQTIAGCSKVARYVDIPLQHIHENMLERMRRETSQQYLVDLLRRIRAGVPGIALRTTFIVGFPGETEQSFATLLDFIRETKFERLGVFAYSREAGTRAGAMAGQISERVKQKRRELAMAEQRRIARKVSESFVGRDIKVLVEGPADAKQGTPANVSSWEHGWLRRPAARAPRTTAGRCFIARGEADAPDIDGRVFVRGRLPVGEFARVKIVGHTDYDLLAEPV